MGNTLLCFDGHPAAWQKLLDDRSLIPGAIEEILRYMPPNKSFGKHAAAALKGRTATTDVLLGGQLIRKGEKVNWSTLSANFDERQFPNPERFDIQRVLIRPS